MERAPPTTEMSPEDLLRQYRAARHPDALGALFDRTAPSLLRVALSIAPDAASAENALQETFLAVIAAPEHWDASRPVMPWLLGILHRQVGKVRRDAARAPDPLRLRPPLSPDDPADAAASREDLQRVRDAIDGLEEPYRAVAVLRWRHGLDPADIADVRGEAPGTTRSLLSRALAKLRARLGGTAALAILPRPENRGLAAVRGHLMARATAASGAVTVAAAVGFGGAFVMKKIVIAVAAVVLVVGGTWWGATQTTQGPPTGDESAAASSVGAPEVPDRGARRRARPSVADDVPATVQDDLLPPVDLDACDRNLDLFGRVVDEQGRPIAGADVRTIAFPWVAALASWDLQQVAEDGPQTRTARDGTFVVRLTRGAIVDLRVTAASFADVVRPDCQAGERVEMTLVHGATLDVTAVDEAAQPVPGVRVRVWRDKQQAGEPIEQERAGTTDAAGRTAFAGLVAGRATVKLEHATLGSPAWQHVTLPAEGTLPLRVTMPAGRTIRGRVIDADTSAPIAGARVGGSTSDDRAATSGADGAYVYPGWTSTGTTVLYARAPGCGTVWKKVPEGGDLDFQLRVGDRVAGRVVRADGTPIDGAYVTASGGGGQGRSIDNVSMRTGADGRFELAGLLHDLPHTLVAAAPGLGRKLVDFDPPPVARGLVDLRDIVLAEGRSISGVAMDGDGRPLVGVAVSILGSNDDRESARSSGAGVAYVSGHASLRADDIGRFRFVGIAPGTYRVSLFVPDAPQTPGVRVVLPEGRDVDGVEIRLAGGRSVTLLVVDDTGKPLPGVYVQVTGTFPVVDGGYPSLIGDTGPDGRVAFRGLPAKETRFFLNGTFENEFLYESVAPFVPDGGEVRVALRRAAVVSGVVRGEDGAPIAGLTVTARRRDGGGDDGTGWSDAAGAFTMKVPAGEAVDLRVDGSQTIQTKELSTSVSTEWRGLLPGVTGPAQGLVLVVRKPSPTTGRTLTVLVRDSAGAPVPNLTVYATRRGGVTQAETPTDATGRARFVGLQAEEVAVHAYCVAGWSPSRPLDVPPKPVLVDAEGQDVTLDCRAGVALRGRVVGPDRSPVRSQWLSVAGDGEETYVVRLDASGRFAVGVVPGAKITLSAAFQNGDEQWAGKLEGIVAGTDEVTLRVGPPAK